MTNEMICKINHVAETMLDAYDYRAIRRLSEFKSEQLGFLQASSEISKSEMASILTDIFGEPVSTWRMMATNNYCRSMNTDQVAAIRKTIKRLRRNVDNIIETAGVLREIGVYFTFLALHMNRGIFGHKTAFRLITVSVRIYDILQRMLPYVFDDVSFTKAVEDTPTVSESSLPTDPDCCSWVPVPSSFIIKDAYR